MDIFEAYLQQQVPKFQSTLICAPIHVRETPPLLQITGWHMHLREYITTRVDVETLRTLVQVTPPSKQKKGLGCLRDVSLDYMKDIRKKAQNSSIGIRSLLMECPRLVSFASLSFFEVNILLAQPKMVPIGECMLTIKHCQHTTIYSTVWHMPSCKHWKAILQDTDFL